MAEFLLHFKLMFNLHKITLAFVNIHPFTTTTIHSICNYFSVLMAWAEILRVANIAFLSRHKYLLREGLKNFNFLEGEGQERVIIRFDFKKKNLLQMA